MGYLNLISPIVPGGVVPQTVYDDTFTSDPFATDLGPYGEPRLVPIVWLGASELQLPELGFYLNRTSESDHTMPSAGGFLLEAVFGTEGITWGATGPYNENGLYWISDDFLTACGIGFSATECFPWALLDGTFTRGSDTISQNGVGAGLSMSVTLFEDEVSCLVGSEVASLTVTGLSAAVRSKLGTLYLQADSGSSANALTGNAILAELKYVADVIGTVTEPVTASYPGTGSGTLTSFAAVRGAHFAGFDR